MRVRCALALPSNKICACPQKHWTLQPQHASVLMLPAGYAESNADTGVCSKQRALPKRQRRGGCQRRGMRCSSGRWGAPPTLATTRCATARRRWRSS